MPSSIDEPMVHILRIKGRATPDQLAEALDLPVDEISLALGELEAQGLVKDSGKPRVGWTITLEGRQAAESRVGEVSSEGKTLIADHYETFRKLNDEVKQLCADWQSRNAITTGPADFSARLATIDEGIQRILAEITPVAKHFAQYGPRFARARAKFGSISDSYLTGIMVDSYHNIWFECHECFFITLGRSRQNEESGR